MASIDVQNSKMFAEALSVEKPDVNIEDIWPQGKNKFASHQEHHKSSQEREITVRRSSNRENLGTEFGD